MLRGSVKGIGYPLYAPVFPLIALPSVTVCHHISTGVYYSLELLVLAKPDCTVDRHVNRKMLYANVSKNSEKSGYLRQSTYIKYY